MIIFKQTINYFIVSQKRGQESEVTRELISLAFIQRLQTNPLKEKKAVGNNNFVRNKQNVRTRIAVEEARDKWRQGGEIKMMADAP